MGMDSVPSRRYGVRFRQRAFAAFLAIAERRDALRLAALAFPPLLPPSFPSATAAGFFSRVTRARIA